MTNEVKNIIRLYEAGGEQNQKAAGVLLGGLGFDYLREFCAHYADALAKIVAAEFLPITAGYEFDFVCSDLLINCENIDGEPVAAVYINDAHVFNLVKSNDTWRAICDKSKRATIARELL